MCDAMKYGLAYRMHLVLISHHSHPVIGKHAQLPVLTNPTKLILVRMR